MLIRAGNVVLHTDAQVGGSIYVLGGALDVDGLIMGDLVVLDGWVTLGPTARIGGDLRIGNGTTRGSELALVEGSIISGLTLPVEQA
ncbi:hypothetical protein [Candidatus Chloroploca asiatica]|uniref:Cell shape determination protein CcmA n=1 Tax=Candidatus Chloroploca asiatica TaxID=1506545 RepID=A0A2H3KX82_9CHLR|nr:hypothetical protein [Candidatus Chloroploca asiatica]PDV98580.1 hypothetical protein A9Q02_14870 [Candidatus Chloroploca asiatica]